MTPGRQVVGHIGKALVAAMEMALKAGDKAAAELVACECVVLAETKDHTNWELIGHVAEHGKGDAVKALQGRARGGRGRRGPSPLPHARLVPGAVDPVARPARGAAAAGRGQAGRDRDRRRARGESARRDAQAAPLITTLPCMRRRPLLRASSCPARSSCRPRLRRRRPDPQPRRCRARRWLVWGGPASPEAASGLSLRGNVAPRLAYPPGRGWTTGRHEQRSVAHARRGNGRPGGGGPDAVLAAALGRADAAVCVAGRVPAGAGDPVGIGLCRGVAGAVGQPGQLDVRGEPAGGAARLHPRGCDGGAQGHLRHPRRQPDDDPGDVRGQRAAAHAGNLELPRHRPGIVQPGRAHHRGRHGGIPRRRGAADPAVRRAAQPLPAAAVRCACC